jgi:hypothetical protein
MPSQSQQRGHHAWGLLITIIVISVLLIAALAFGIWAFMGRQDYKNNSDKKVTNAVAIAIQKEDSKKDSEFVDKEKYPYKSYLGPDTWGSVNISYPKTWGAYVIQQDQSGTPIDAYFHPNFVPGTQSGTNYALRVQVINQTYDAAMKQLEGKVKGGKVTVSPFVPKNVANITGSRVTGEINSGQQDVMVLLPLRDKTVKLWTEAPQFVSDFDNIILAGFKYTP